MSAHIETIRKNQFYAEMHDELEIAYDIVFVINANSKGWILDKICKIVEKYSDLNCYFLYSERNDQLTGPLPKARAYFFAHFAIAFWTMVKYPDVFGGSIFTYFTHFDQNKGVSRSELIDFMNICDHVFVMNSSHERALVSLGALSDRVTTVLGGADPEVFPRHDRGKGLVGFVGAYYPRKQPEKMAALIRSMPDVDFLLLAPGEEHVENNGMLWRNWGEFDALRNLPNLRYVEAPYEDYPEYFAQMDVYVSLSSQEGGPIPVIEAMMSNAIPIATNTGFAEDVLTGDLGKYIVDIDASVETIATAVRTALNDKTTDVRALAEHISWESVGQSILDIIRPTLALDRQEPFVDFGVPVAFRATSAGRYFLGADWSLESGVAQPVASPASLTFRLRDAAPGRFRVALGFDLPGAEQAQAAGAPEWQVDLTLNGRPIFSQALAASGRAVAHSWIDLDAAAVAQDLVLTVAFAPIDVTAQGTLTPTLRDMRWDPVDILPEALVHDFTLEDARGAYLCTRWHHLETTGCWTDGPKGTAALYLPAAREPREVDAVVSGRVLGAEQEDGSEVTMEVSVGGQTETYSLLYETDETVQKVLPGIKIPADTTGPVLVTIARKTSFAPIDLQSNWMDRRDLGFHLNHIELKPQRKKRLRGLA